MRTLPVRALAIALCVLGPGTSGCRRATNSPEYTEAQGLHDRLVAEQGDDAYLSAEMEKVEQLLAQVPEKSLDAQAAQALTTRIQEERERIRTGREAAAAEPTEDGSPSFDSPSGGATMEAPPEPADAGAPRPIQGMLLAEFQRLFGGCFVPGQDLLISGVGVRQTYEVRDLPSCQTQHADYVNLVVVIDNNAIAGFAQKQAMKLSLPDGGPAPEQTEAAPAQPAPEPAQPEQPPPPPEDQSGRDYGGIKY